MKIKELHIQNYKSLVDLKIVEPNPFTVFVGPNGAGKSNIFEALEFLSMCDKTFPDKCLQFFGGISEIINFNKILSNGHERFKKILELTFNIDFLEFNSELGLLATVFNKDRLLYSSSRSNNFSSLETNVFSKEFDSVDFRKRVENLNSLKYKQIIQNFSRIFVNDRKPLKQNFTDDLKITSTGSNLEKVLKRILKNEYKREEIIEWLDLLVPGFENIEIKSEELSGTDALLIYEKGTKKPFNKSLISDGTYNILALLTAVYQSDEPQFLCIEEPENGLNPKVQRELVNLFRSKCEEEGHFIWLNTHSQTIVSELEPKEAILVEKKNGETKIKQLKDFKLHGLKMDEAWLSNALGGGTPW